MEENCNGCMEGELIFKVSGVIAIYGRHKLIKYLPNEDLEDQYYCEKHAREIDYLREILEEAEIQGKIGMEEIRMIEDGLEDIKRDSTLGLAGKRWQNDPRYSPR